MTIIFIFYILVQPVYKGVVLLVNRAHKIKLDLTKEQAHYCARSAGVARFAYNWTLKNYQKQYRAFKSGYINKSPNISDLRKLFNSQKKTRFPFALEVSKYCSQDAQMRLGDALNNFFNNKSKFPSFKSKSSHNSFYLGNDSFSIVTKIDTLTQKESYFIRVPLLKSLMRLTEKPRFEGKIMSATFSKRADNWFVSISYETDLAIVSSPQISCGIDVGISTLATVIDSNNVITKCDNPKAYRKNIKRLKYLQRCLSRKQKGSNNRKKAKQKLARFHEHIANIRKDNLHKFTTNIVDKYSSITIEELNVKGMMKNHRLAGSIADASFFMFKQMLEYKTKLTAGNVRKVNKFYPSSKLCSVCGIKNIKLELKDRSWKCSCGAIHDRDENAAKNILNCPDKECIWKEKKEIKSRIERKKVKLESEKNSLPIANGEVKLVENKGSILGSDEPSITLSEKQEIKKSKSKKFNKDSKKVNVE